MPYIKKEEVIAKRKALKAALPQFKMSITRENYSGIRVAIMAGPVDFGTEHIGLNEHVNYHEPRWDRVTEQYVSNPEIAALMDVIMPILNQGLGHGFEDSDYGHVPDFYTWVQIGQWDKPYVCNQTA
jgi:hypothetical protein